MASPAKLLAIRLSLVVLSGCGSRGGDVAPSVTVSELAEITSQNAPDIAGAVIQATLEGGDLGSFAGIGSGSIASDPNSQVLSKLGQVQSSQTESLRQKALTGVLQAPLPPQTRNCLQGGTATLSGEIASPLTLSPDDTFTTVYSACDDGFAVVSGTYEMRITSFTGDFLGGSFSFEVAVTLTEFQLMNAAGTGPINGEVFMSFDASASPSVTVSISSTFLSVVDGTSSQTLTNYSITQVIDTVTNSYSMSGYGSVESSSFTGRVTFSISAALHGDGDGFAFNGEFTVTGGGGGSITIIVLDDVFIRLEIDFDGDGVLDEIVDATWQELLAQS